MLAPAERQRLEERSAAEERQSGTQVVVAIFPSLAGESLEDVSIRLAEQWKLGQRGRDNGVLLLVFLKEHKLRMEVGYGLEARLTDVVAASIIRNGITPRFREGRYAAGLDAGLTAIFQAVAGEYRATPKPPAASDFVSLLPLALGLVIMLIVLGGMLAGAARGRPGSRHGYTAGPGWWYYGGTGFGGGFGSRGGGGFGGGGFSGGGGAFGGGGASGDW